MAVEPQALVNQAVFAWLRINGYHLANSGQPFMAVSVAREVTPVSVVADPTPPVTEPNSQPDIPEAFSSDVLAAPVEEPPQPPLPIEQLTEAKPVPSWIETALGDPALPDEQPDDVEAPPPPVEPPSLFEEFGADSAAPEKPEPAAEPSEPEEPVEPEPDEPEPARADATVVTRASTLGTLYLERDGLPLIAVAKERFIIGRGPECDLVIDSPRVSREHLAISRVGSTFLIQDLNSSNGTWYGEERVYNREIEDADVIYLGDEPVTFFVKEP